MSKVAVIHTSTTPPSVVEILAGCLEFPSEIKCVHHSTELRRVIRHIQAHRDEYLCVINACTGADIDLDDVSAASAALLLEAANLPYTGCRAVCLGYSLDTLLMMIRYAPVSLPRYREVKCPGDIHSAVEALRAPLRIASMTPCLGALDRVVTVDGAPAEVIVGECYEEYGPLVVLEHPAMYKGGVDVLVVGHSIISAVSAEDGETQAHTALPLCEEAARCFAKNVLYYRGTALLSFAPLPVSDKAGETVYNLVRLTLHCPLLDLPSALQAKVDTKIVLSEMIQQALDLHPKPAYKMHLMEGEQSRMGYIMVAARDFEKGQVVFEDECRSFAMVTRPHVERYWDLEMKKTFTEYAWPLDSEGHLYAMWEEDPARWRPLNHSCDPNCIFAAPHSLNVIAARDIKAGDNLTMDYATFCDHTMKPFECFCGASCCRGRIVPDEASLLKYGGNTWLRKVPGPVKPLL